MDSYLQEAEKVVGLRGVATDDRGLADPVCERRALAQRAVLHRGREERRGVHLLPEVEPIDIPMRHQRTSKWLSRQTVGDLRGLVPVAGNVVEVKLDDRPEGVDDVGRVVVVQEPVGVGDDGGSPQSRPI